VRERRKQNPNLRSQQNAQYKKTGTSVIKRHVNVRKREAKDTSKIKRLNWRWWLVHFRSQGLTPAFARECWVNRCDETGARCKSYKINNERIMEVKMPDSVSLSKIRSAERTLEKKFHTKRQLARDHLQTAIAVEGSLGEHDLSDWDPNETSCEEDDRDEPANDGEQDHTARQHIDGVEMPPSSEDEGGEEEAETKEPEVEETGNDSEDPPSSNDEEADPALRTAPGARSVMDNTPVQPVRFHSLRGRPASAPAVAATPVKRPRTVAPAPAASPAPMSLDTQSETKGKNKTDAVIEASDVGAELRSVIIDCQNEFEESFDMWVVQDAMKDLPAALADAAQVSF